MELSLLTMTGKNVPFDLPSELSRLVLEMLGLKDLVRLDSAFCSHTYRPELIRVMMLLSLTATERYNRAIDVDIIKWLYIREYKAKELDLTNKDTFTACMQTSCVF